MKYLVNLSGGSGSAVALARTIERYGKDNVDAVFADTNAEHPSLYTLLDEIEAVFAIPVSRLTNGGKDVWDVFFESRLMKTPNGGCKAAIELKHKPLDAYRDSRYTPDTATIVMGLDWMEPERMARAQKRMAPWTVEFPLTWPKRLSKCEEIEELTRLGLSVPTLYTLGHKHNNCAGACVLAGQGQWAALLADDPERFDHYATKEREWRAFIGQDYAILKDRRGGALKPMTLDQLRERAKAGDSFREWRSTCNCMGYAEDAVQTTLLNE
jgi:hypothetical protein